ncbi:MAG: hypothetical protein P8126_00795 [Gammaproteobacteria bacterium]|jgi:hypothetical protein
MSIIQIVLSADVIMAAVVYAAAAIAGTWIFDRVHHALVQPVLLWGWEHIAMPLLRAALMLIFILLAYPALFGLTEAPTLGDLLSREELRVNTLLNVLFVVTLLFPLIPVLGERDELVLPAQGIAASLLLFSWLVAALGAGPVHYWPGSMTVALILLLAVITHWLAVSLAVLAGERLDRALNVENAGELLARALVLFMQYPVIVVFCHGLGEQLA